MSSSASRYIPLVESYAQRIREGQLLPGARMPSVRGLTKLHGVALATAHRVYSELEQSGLIVGEVGRGTFVRDLSIQRPSALRQGQTMTGVVDLSFNYPTVPGQDEMLRESLRSLAGRGDIDAMLYSPPQGGRMQERETAARHLRNRGLRLPGAQVLIVNGAQHGLAIALQALLRPGDLVAVDALTYPGFRSLALANRIDPCPVRQVDGVTDLDALASLCRRRRVSAVYTMPTLHNPLGSVMTIDQRRRLVAIAEQHDLLIIEDGAYAFLGEPAPPPLMALAPHRTIYVSGLSKSVASGLRVGMVAAPLAWIQALEEAIRLTTWSAPALTVAIACEWIQDGVVDQLEESKRADARQRQRVARAALKGLRPIGHRTSYFLWLDLPAGVRAEAAAAELSQHGIVVATGDAFSAATSAQQGLRVAIGSVPLDMLSKALNVVRETVEALA